MFLLEWGSKTEYYLSLLFAEMGMSLFIFSSLSPTIVKSEGKLSESETPVIKTATASIKHIAVIILGILFNLKTSFVPHL